MKAQGAALGNEIYSGIPAPTGRPQGSDGRTRAAPLGLDDDTAASPRAAPWAGIQSARWAWKRRIR